MLVKKGEKFPSDLVLLSSSAEDGTCFIETCELDGFVINFIPSSPQI